MSPLGLYLDEDIQRNSLSAALRNRGLLILTASEAGMVAKIDEHQLAFAADRGLTLVTFNEGDFANLHSKWMRTGRNHAGIVLCPQQRYSVGELV